MMNYYELFNAIKDTDAKMVLLQNFKEAFAENYKAMQANNTTRKQAQKTYLSDKNICTDNEMGGVFSNGVSILNIPSEKNEYGRKTDIKKFAIEHLKDRVPVECYITDSIAVAKSLGWRANGKNQKYGLQINGAWYDMTLVYRLYSCIADKNESCKVEQKVFDDKGRKSLILSSKNGLAIILPVVCGWNPDYDCNYSHFVEVEKALDEETAIPFN